MQVLIGCEESQVVCKAFRDRGHEAYSCDLQDTRGVPDWHIKGDIMDAIKVAKWDLIILHPDCTALAVSGNAHYATGKPNAEQRRQSILWTVDLWEKACSACDRVALENPVSVIFQYLMWHDLQYIQPWQFGHGETKKTGLALYGLPYLKPTNIVEGRFDRTLSMGPSPTRKRDRSVTYQGIADAMAKQWGDTVRQSLPGDTLK